MQAYCISRFQHGSLKEKRQAFLCHEAHKKIQIFHCNTNLIHWECFVLWTYSCYSLLVWKPRELEVSKNFVPKFSQARTDSLYWCLVFCIRGFRLGKRVFEY